MTWQSVGNAPPQLGCILSLAFAFRCDSVTRNSKRLCQTPVSRATSSEFNVHAVVRLRHKSPHGKGIECAESVLVQKSSASLNQCRHSINVLARDVMVAEDRLRIQSLSPSSFDHRLRSVIHPCSSADNTAFNSAEPSVQQAVAATAIRRMRLLRRAESIPC